METLDPLTEIINSGQAFSTAITLEKIVWLIIGIFFIGATLRSIIDSLQIQGYLNFKSFLKFLKNYKPKDEGSF